MEYMLLRTSHIVGLVFICCVISYTNCSTEAMNRVHACFSEYLAIDCQPDELIVFGSAVYGRNDSDVARLCKTQYDNGCGIDVRFDLSQRCSGRDKCTVVVGKDLFNDPCGHEEFLVVTYKCISHYAVDQSCRASPSSPSYADTGYIASPNYPADYYMSASCVWLIVVQKRQSLRLTVYDFELAVKRGGNCHDFLRINSGDNQYFMDCGAQDKFLIDIYENHVKVQFHVGINSNTRRGFLLHYEAIGPGCRDISVGENGTVIYSMHDDELWATIRCAMGTYMGPDFVTSRTLRCLNTDQWNDTFYDCLTLTANLLPMTPAPPYVEASPFPEQLAKSSSVVGVALGVVSTLLLIMLLVVLALYFHRRRKRAERKLDQMRVVFNNLQENAWNEDAMSPHHVNDYTVTPGGATYRKVASKASFKAIPNACRDDELQGCNLLAPQTYPDDEYCYDEVAQMKANETPIQGYYDTSRNFPNTLVRTPRKNIFSLKSEGSSSRDSVLDSPTAFDFDDGEFYLHQPAPPVPNRRPRHRRARSGHWDHKSNRAPAPPSVSPTKSLLTQSAPDLLALAGDLSDLPRDSTNPIGFNNGTDEGTRGTMPGYGRTNRPRTNTGGHRTVRKMRSRSGSRVNVRH